jgi:hypothetical protein
MIDKAARAAILIVHEQFADARQADASATSFDTGDKVALIDANLFISWCREDEDMPRRSRYDHLFALLKRFLSSERDVEHDLERPLPHCYHQTKQRFYSWHGASSDVCLSLPLCDAEPIGRALVWREPELSSTMTWWTAHDRRPRHRSALDHRYLFLGKAGGEADRRGYVVFVQSKPMTEEAFRQSWIKRHEPAVLKFEPHYYCREFAEQVKADQASRELLMCVVPFAPSEEAGSSTFDAALEKITSLLCGEFGPTPDDVAEDTAGAEENHAAWLSLTRYADIFLGDGARKHMLDEHLRSKLEPAGKGRADAGTA